MRFGSLFSGIGGLDLGLERAGMECVWQVEVDDYATRVLERHWPHVPRWRDVWGFIGDANGGDVAPQQAGHQEKRKPSRNCSWHAVDLICGGFPCQPVSVAGRRQGDRDERWLWPAFREVVSIFRPRWVVVENVPGLLSADSGRLFGGILADLAELGFDAEWQVLPAAAFGAPHLRKRVFVIAHCNSQRFTWGQKQDGSSFEPEQQAPRRDYAGGLGGDASDTNSNTLRQQSGGQCGARGPAQATIDQFNGWRSVKPTIRRGDDGTAYRVDRLRGLGNAVVPQVAEWIGRRIMTAGRTDGR